MLEAHSLFVEEAARNKFVLVHLQDYYSNLVVAFQVVVVAGCMCCIHFPAGLASHLFVLDMQVVVEEELHYQQRLM